MSQQPITRQIVLSVSPELLEQLDMVATEQNLDVPTFCRNAVRSQLSRLNGPKTRQRRSREAGFALLSLLSRHPATERTVAHAANS